METVDVVMKVQELFDDRWDLILGFKEFLPAGYEIAVPIEEEIAYYVKNIDLKEP